MIENKDLISPAPGKDVSQVLEGTSIQNWPAPILKRILAYVLDVSVVSIILYVAILAAIVLGLGGVFAAAKIAMLRGADGFALVALIIYLVLFLIGSLAIWHGYFVYFEVKKGTTPGKKAFGLRVISLQHPKLTVGQAILRDMFRYIDAWLILPGLISMLVSQKKQRLGDMAAGTQVVYSPRSEAQKTFLYMGQDDYHLMLEELQPPAMALGDARNYLRFAYPFFISKRMQFSEAEVEEWAQYVRRIVTHPKVQDNDRDLLLRFFAEYCLKTTQSKQVR